VRDEARRAELAELARSSAAEFAYDRFAERLDALVDAMTVPA
jgi:hypothetical protein